MSEMLMFQKKTSIEDSTYYANYSHSIISNSNDYYNISEVNSYAYKKRPSNDPDFVYDYEPAKSITTNLIFMPTQKSKVSFSMAIGNPLGIDLTTNIFGNTYLTGAGSAVGDHKFYQFILQQRIFDGNPFGWSLGLTTHKKSIMVATPTNCPGFYCSKEFDSRSIGVRSVIILAPIKTYGESRPFFHGIISINYDLNLKAFYPRLGLSLGFY